MGYSVSMKRGSVFNVGDMVSYRKSINFHDPKNYVGIIKEVGHNGFSHWYKVDWLNVRDNHISVGWANAFTEDKLSPYEAN